MEIINRLKVILIAYGVLLILLITGLMLKQDHLLLIILLIVATVASLVTMYIYVAKPILSFDKLLDSVIENSHVSDGVLLIQPEDLMLIKKIKAVISRYASNQVQKNMAIVFDKQAELAALQSQINPHFLYNTLESIRGQAMIDDNMEIAKMVETLGLFFRYSIGRKGDLVTIRDELSNVKNYMMIQQYRFNSRFTLRIVMDESDEYAYDFFVPKLILQPIIENALFHGLEDSVDKGEVQIRIEVTETNLVITVSDNGLGMSRDQLNQLNASIKRLNTLTETDHLAEIENSKNKRGGIALTNIQQRIQLLFGQEYGITVYSTLNHGTDVEIILPINRDRNLISDEA